jgi:glycosyltransferase involved in cell wall biosynthesis
VTVLNYNYGRYLGQCMESILAQTLDDFEVIVVDDCSTDGSLDVVRPYVADGRVRLVAHEANRGYLASLIEGTEAHSRGEFVSVISADDLARRPDAFERQVAMLRAHPGAGFCFSHYEKLLGAEGLSLGIHESLAGDAVVPGAEAFRRLASDPMMRVLHTGTVIRRHAYVAAGGYRHDVPHALDLAMWLALSMRGDVAYIADSLYAYRQHDSQMSGSLRGYRALMRETFQLVDEAIAEARERGIETAGLRRGVSRAYLFGWAMDEAFRGARALPMRRCLEALRLRPVDALASRAFWVILLRAALGARAFGALRSTSRAVLTPLRLPAPIP